jgi:hypothetical protein
MEFPMDKKSSRLILFIALLLMQAVVYATDIYCDDNPKNLDTYLTIHEVLFMQRDESRVAEFYAPEVISHNLDAGGEAVEPGETGRAYKASAIDIYRFKDNMVVERWGNNDGVTLLRQLGLLKE